MNRVILMLGMMSNMKGVSHHLLILNSFSEQVKATLMTKKKLTHS